MLIEFKVSNFRSIRDEQTFSLVAASDKESRRSNVLAAGAPATPDLLRSAVIYGANAAGKSNIITALKFVRRFVRDSAKAGQQGDAIGVVPFMLDAVSADRPSTFELTFVQGKVRYQYGFAVTRQRVESEWLLAYPKGQPQSWFDRTADSSDWNFGAKLRGQRKVWQNATRENALFLSTAVQLNAEQLRPVFDWFRRLRIIGPYVNVDPQFTMKQCETNADIRARVAEFLGAADLGINGVAIHRKKRDRAALPTVLSKLLKDDFLEEIAQGEVMDVRFTHRLPDGNEAKLPMREESGGTQKLFALAGPWLDVLDNGYVLFVDELDTSLHPHLIRLLVDLFHNPSVNRHGAQLVFSTHDTNMLNRELFRRDQIWFVEKDRQLQSHLYPLTDFSPRKGENVERGYLQGRYGALPFLGELIAA